MTVTFEDREKGFERKFAHDEEMQFRARARRNRLLGLWAAGRMGLAGEDAARNYVQTVIRAGATGAGEDDVFVKIRDDLRAKGTAVTEQEIRNRMAQLLAEAKAGLLAETD